MRWEGGGAPPPPITHPTLTPRSPPGAYLYGDLVDFLYTGLPRSAITLNRTIDDLGPDPSRPTVDGVTYDLAIVADGGWSSLRTKYFGPDVPEFAGWQAWRFRVSAEHVPGGMEAEGGYENGVYGVMCLNVACNDGTDLIAGGVSIPADESEVVVPAKGTNRQTGVAEPSPAAPVPDILPLLRKEFRTAAGGKLVEIFEAAARHGKITPNPQYEFAAREVVKGRLVLVGDAAHMAVPRTASGAHTAGLDGHALLECFAPLVLKAGGGGGGGAGGWDAVVASGLAAYGPPAVARALALYERSIEVSKPVTRPGWVRGPRGGVRTTGRAEL